MSATDHAATTESQAPGLSFAELTARVPPIHTSRSTTYRIHPRLAAFLDAQIQPSFVTLETGSGLSTLVILRKGVAKHIAIAPDGDEFQAIREFCAENGIATGEFQSLAMRSQDYLPRASLDPLNLVLVDGDHSFPVPFIDWYYTADALVVGGVMVIDDIQLITGRLLADFMDADPKWERILYEERRFAVFRKLSHPVHSGRWDEQPYVAASNPVEYVSVSRRVSIHPAVGALMILYGYLPAPVQATYRALRRLARRAARR